MPSCRSRSIRRRVSSEAATIRARDAARAARLSAFAIAVATSPVKPVRRDSVSPGKRLVDLLRVDEQSAPQAALDDDRAADRGADPELVSNERGDAPGNAVVVVYPDGSARPRDRRCQIAPFERPRTRNQWVCSAVLVFGGPGRYDSHRVMALVTGHSGEVSAEQPPDLRRDRREQLLRLRPERHQRRDPPQRRLLLGQPGELGAVLRVRDRRRQQVGEVGEARLGIRRQRLRFRRPGCHHAPEASFDDDGSASCGPNSCSLQGLRQRASGMRVAVDPGRPSRPKHQLRDTLTLQRQPRTNLEFGRNLNGLAPPRDYGCGSVGLVAKNSRSVDRDEPPDLLGNGGEDLSRRQTARHKGRHPPERRLLLGQHPVALLRFAQIGLRLSPLGHLAPDRIGQPFLEHRRCRPLDPPYEPTLQTYRFSNETVASASTISFRLDFVRSRSSG